MRRMAKGRGRASEEARTPHAPHERKRGIEPIGIGEGSRGPWGGACTHTRGRHDGGRSPNASHNRRGVIAAKRNLSRRRGRVVGEERL